MSKVSNLIIGLPLLEKMMVKGEGVIDFTV